MLYSIVLRSIHDSSSAAQLPDALHGPVDDPSELSPVITPASLAQSLLGVLRRKPGAISPGFLRRAQPKHLAEMSVDRKVFLAGSCSRFPRAAAPNISGERGFFDPPMNSRFFECLECRRLGMGQPPFRAALGKRPSPAAPGPNQQKLDSTAAHPVANRSGLFAFAQFAKVRQSYELSRCRGCPI